MRTVGIAIPTYEREALTFEAFADVYHDPRVGAITIVDDASPTAVYQGMVMRAHVLHKIALHRNAMNLGLYRNKRRAVEQAAEPWVVLFDSDNRLEAMYLDALFDLPQWRPDTLYLPVWAMPSLDYRSYAGLVVTQRTMAAYAQQPLFLTALNTGNCFVHREAYLDVFDDGAEPFAADSLYFAYCWLASGRRILFTPGLCYEHRVHNGEWVRLAAQSTAFAEEIAMLMRTGVYVDA